MERSGLRIRQHLFRAEEGAQHEAAQAQRDAVHVWHEGVAVKRLRLSRRQFPSGNLFGPTIDGDRRFPGGSKIAGPFRLAKGCAKART
jgi:hypothetical protein